MGKCFVLLGLVVSASASFAQFKPLDPDLTGFKYPFPVSKFEVKDQNQIMTMAYMDVAPSASNGQTVVLMHGKNFSGHYWEKTIRDLSREGYRVIVPDQIGFGKSSKPQSFQFSFHSLARYTGDLLTSLKIDKIKLVGHSMGGMLATRFALIYPDRVQSLVLVNPIGLEDYQNLVPYRKVSEVFAGELKANEQSIRGYQQNVYFDGKWKSEYDSLLTVLVGWTLHPEYAKVAWNAALTADMIYSQPVVHEFPLLKMPTQLIIGTRDRTAIGKDRVSPEKQKDLGRYDLLGKSAAKAIPYSQLVEFENAGHMPQIEVYDKYISALLTFLRL